LVESFDKEVSNAKDTRKVIACLCDYSKKYDALGNTKTYPEASDSAVREVVIWHAEQILKKHGYGSIDAWALDIWS